MRERRPGSSRLTAFLAGPPPSAAGRWLRGIRWLLPLFLAGVALWFELNEHLLHESSEISPAFFGELLIFAGIGPIAVAFTLGWVSQLVAGYQATSAALVDVNRGLEASVIERTRNLQTASDQLSATNEDLSRANDELRQLDRLKSEFVSLVSHQLRAPLTNIIGALEMVAEDAALLPPASRRTLEILTMEGNRLSHLIQTILDVSRLESGGLTLRLGPVAIEPLLMRTCSSAFAAEPSRSWSVTVSPGLPPAWADEVLLEEVVRSLVENAMRYSPPDQPIDIRAQQLDGVITVSVVDHGPGVPESEREMIFRSFHRVDANDSTVAGYGLGLYFADKLTRAHDGEIWVESPVHDEPAAPGARFTFSIPIAGEEPDA
jgi:signal transduction histidine kinase